MNKRQVQNAMNKGFSHLEFTANHQREVLSKVRGDKPVKKKLSVGLVFAMVLLLIAFAAVAATLLWENYAAQVKQTENEQGVYEHWQTKDKIDLVRALIELGYVEETDGINRIFDSATSEADIHAIADQVLMDLTQRDVSDISLAEITYAVMGYFTSWTPEQRVWWEELMGYASGAVDTFVIPGSQDISEEDAIRIGKDRLLQAYGFESDYLDRENVEASADLYITNQRPDYRRWMVIFSEYREGSDHYLERAYSVVVDNTGIVIADPDVEAYLPEDYIEMVNNLPGRPTTAVYQAYDKIYEKEGWMNLWAWPLESKAEFSETVAPLVRAIVDSGDLTPLYYNGKDPDLYLIAPATFTYGMPGQQDMSQDDALNIAKQTLMATYNLSSETVSLYDYIYTYFDVTNPSVPLWKFVFHTSRSEEFKGGREGEQAWLRYKVEIASRTGVVTKAEEFEFQIPGADLEYDLKLY